MNGRDMEAPVTRRELHEALDTWAGAIKEQFKEQFKELFKEQSAELRAEMNEFRVEMRALIQTTESNLIARMDSMFDPHRDVPARVAALEAQALPERVSKLEAKVFAPARRTRRARRSR